jgi:hypothetical protein
MLRIVQSKLDASRQFLAINFVKSYLPLEPAEQQEYTQISEKTSPKEVKIMELTWADQIRNEGEARGKANTLLEVLELRGLKATQTQRDAVLACTDAAQLKDMAQKGDLRDDGRAGLWENSRDKTCQEKIKISAR